MPTGRRAGGRAVANPAALHARLLKHAPELVAHDLPGGEPKTKRKRKRRQSQCFHMWDRLLGGRPGPCQQPRGRSARAALLPGGRAGPCQQPNGRPARGRHVLPRQDFTGGLAGWPHLRGARLARPTGSTCPLLCSAAGPIWQGPSCGHVPQRRFPGSFKRLGSFPACQPPSHPCLGPPRRQRACSSAPGGCRARPARCAPTHAAPGRVGGRWGVEWWWGRGGRGVHTNEWMLDQRGDAAWRAPSRRAAHAPAAHGAETLPRARAAGLQRQPAPRWPAQRTTHPATKEAQLATGRVKDLPPPPRGSNPPLASPLRAR